MPAADSGMIVGFDHARRPRAARGAIAATTNALETPAIERTMRRFWSIALDLSPIEHFSIMKQTISFRSRRARSAGLLLLALASAASVSAWAYAPWHRSTLIRHYDEHGIVIGIESVGDCGFSLIGSTGVTTTEEVYSCDLDVPVPF